jgi:hypothetical protein
MSSSGVRLDALVGLYRPFEDDKARHSFDVSTPLSWKQNILAVRDIVLVLNHSDRSAVALAVHVDK